MILTRRVIVKQCWAKNVVEKDNTTRGVTFRSSKTWKGHNSLNIYLNRVSNKFIGIFTKSKSLQSSQLSQSRHRQQQYMRLKLEGSF